ncbi:hypothetical protein D3C76_1832920 [compost metagenome]
MPASEYQRTNAVKAVKHGQKMRINHLPEKRQTGQQAEKYNPSGNRHTFAKGYAKPGSLRYLRLCKEEPAE